MRLSPAAVAIGLLMHACSPPAGPSHYQWDGCARATRSIAAFSVTRPDLLDKAIDRCRPFGFVERDLYGLQTWESNHTLSASDIKQFQALIDKSVIAAEPAQIG